jgi:hypothetical protein
VASGVLTRTQLTSTAWRRLFRDVYADAALPDTHETAVAGAALIVPPSAVFAGRSAAHLLGAESLAEPLVAVEYDGAWHGRPGQLAHDRRRLNALVAVGWTVLHVTAADMLLAGARPRGCRPLGRFQEATFPALAMNAVAPSRVPP